MHWHPDNGANAAKFYPSKGRVGKKMTGGSNKTAALRQMAQDTFRWWCRAYKKRNGRGPSRDEMRVATDNPHQMMKDISRWCGHATMTIKHTNNCNCVVCKKRGKVHTSRDGSYQGDALLAWLEENEKTAAEKAAKEEAERLEMQRSFEEASRKAKARANCQIPINILKRLASGLISNDVIKGCFSVTDDDIQKGLEAYGL